MPNVLAMSFEGELTPSFDLRCLHHGRKPPDGWGIGYYPGGEPSATVLKEPAPPSGSIRSEIIKAWEHLASSLLVMHIRTAKWGQISDANTQPFSRSWGGRDWLFAHSGSLKNRLEHTPYSELDPTSPSGLRPAAPFTASDGICARPAAPAAEAHADALRFEPVGSTDTELVFCDLMERIARRGWRTLGDVDPEALRSWLDAINDHGSMNTLLTDGRDLAIYADRNSDGELHFWQLRPPYGFVGFGDPDLDVDLTRRGVKARKGVIVASNPLAPKRDTVTDWKRVPPGSLLIVRQGSVRAEAHLPTDPTKGARPMGSIPVAPMPRDPVRSQVRRYDVVHRTSYRYERPIERSAHVFRLQPTHDRAQTLLRHSLTVSVDGRTQDYEDVFGNNVRRLALDTPFQELIIEARSQVECLDVDPLGSSQLRMRSTIPLVWMPWQRQVLQPFLLPPELPESELSELNEYAMSFVERNDYDLLDTLLDLNQSIFKDYAYRQGTTNLATTPFDVYANRRGVCQDFANLFICLARLLSVPARYVCGYIYTGAKHENQRQGEASHAWAQVYLPQVGWRGFDPTNGCVTQTEHIRVAVGRNYVDATPTSGTIFVGGGGKETLDVDVRVERAPE